LPIQGFHDIVLRLDQYLVLILTSDILSAMNKVDSLKKRRDIVLREIIRLEEEYKTTNVNSVERATFLGSLVQLRSELSDILREIIGLLVKEVQS
jgi:hypothetical protein